MKQMLREMKIHSVISMLHLILGIGGMGCIVLIGQRELLMQLLGIMPKTEEFTSGDKIICMIAAAMFLFALYLLMLALSGKSQKRVKEFLSKLDAGEQEKLVFDYQNAWRGSRTIRIGQKYTFVLDEGAAIYLNSDIVWLYEWSETITRNAVSHTNYYFDLYLLNHEEPEIIGTTKKTYSAIMEYYRNHFPHIVVGNSDEASYLYRKDRDQFLHLQYYDTQNKGE